MKTLAAAIIAPIIGIFILSDNAAAECKGAQNLPSQQSFVPFKPNSDQISPADTGQLKQWISEMNSRYPIQNWVFVIGSASASETEPKRLAMKRATAVTKNIIDYGLVSAPFQIKTQIYPSEGTNQPGEETREVTVQISPGCPNNCCDNN